MKAVKKTTKPVKKTVKAVKKPVKKTAKAVKKPVKAAAKEPAKTKRVRKTTELGPYKNIRRPLSSEGKQIIANVDHQQALLVQFFGTRPVLSPAQRKRLFGSGIRRYGFLDKTMDISESNMQYAPSTFNRDALKNRVELIENLRNIRIAVTQLLEAVDDRLLQAGDDGYRIALVYYNAVQSQARLGDVGARMVFETLRPFFARGRRSDVIDDSPTQKQIVRDTKAVLRGSKEGEVLVKGSRRASTRKELEVMDETGKPRGGIKMMEKE